MFKIQQVSLCKAIHFLSDGFLLRGTLHLPTDACPPVVIGSHGLLSDSESPKQLELATRCNALGLAYFRFDHRGCGRSQGYFPEATSLKARASDLVHAVRMIRSRRDTGSRFGLFGSSMGGATCLAVAGDVGAESLVIYAAPLRSHTVNHPPTGIIPFDFDISAKAKGLNNILIIHGDADEIVPCSDAEEIFNSADEPKRIVRQKQGDHPMSRKSHQQTFIRDAGRWFKATLLP